MDLQTTRPLAFGPIAFEFTAFTTGNGRGTSVIRQDLTAKQIQLSLGIMTPYQRSSRPYQPPPPIGCLAAFLAFCGILVGFFGMWLVGVVTTALWLFKTPMRAAFGITVFVFCFVNLIHILRTPRRKP